MGADDLEEALRIPPGRLWLFRLLCVAGGVLLGAAAVEACLVLFNVGPQLNVVYGENYRLSDNPVLRYELVPGSPDRAGRISSAGLRDREFDVPKPEGVFRIAVLGDSVAYAHHLYRDQTHPKQLEALLGAHAPPEAPRFEVLNLGVQGYSALQAVESLRVKGLRFQPDLVIYGYVLNDPLRSHLIAEALEDMNRRAEEQLSDALARGLGRHLSRFRLYAVLRSPRIDPPTDSDVEWAAPLYVAQSGGSEERYLRWLHADPEAWGSVSTALADLAGITAGPPPIPVLVLVFPIEWRAGFAAYPLGDVHEKVIGEARRNGAATLDLAPVFARAEAELPGTDFFKDLVHTNVTGNRLVATAILEWACDADALPGACRTLSNLRGSGDPAAAFTKLVD
jgi:hypothetical protein